MNYETYSLGIDEVREITKTLEVKDSDRKIINISFYIASEEAQSAMLKMLEDYEDTQFIINVPDAEMLLPTVRSRLIDVTSLGKENISSEGKENLINISNIKGNLLIVKKDKDIHEALVNKYIKMTVTDRLKCKEVEYMLDKETQTGLKNKEIKSKDDIHKFLTSIIYKLLNIYKEKPEQNIKEQINQFNTLAEYIIKPGSSAKMIMEYVAYRLKV